MKIFSGIANIPLTQKICLAGLFTALATILQKILAINYLAALPFFRISFGAPAVIVFASIFLGPFFGAAVGAFSDILGYFAFDMSSLKYMPQITLIYLLLGFSGYFVYQLINNIKNETAVFIIEIIFLSFSFVGVTCYLTLAYDCSLLAKILIPIGLFILITILVIFQRIFRKKEGKFYAPIKLSFTYLILDVFVLVLFGSLMKAWAFSSSSESMWSLYVTVLITQCFVMIFNVVFSTILLSTFFRLTKKYTRVDYDWE